MVSLEEVRAVALALPGVRESPDYLAFTVTVKGKQKGFAWAWRERVHPKKPKIPNPRVLGLSVSSLSEKEVILSSDPDKFFTEPHYNGFPAILARLDQAHIAEISDLLEHTWKYVASMAFGTLQILA